MEEWDHEARIVPELVLLAPCFNLVRNASHFGSQANFVDRLTSDSDVGVLCAHDRKVLITSQSKDALSGFCQRSNCREHAQMMPALCV